MIIAIDGYEANTTERVGIGRYAYEILKHIYTICEKNEKLSAENSFRVYLPDSPRADMPRQTSWWRYRVVTPRRFWTFFGLPLALTLDMPRAHVIFSPTHYVPRFIGTKKVMAIMDCSYLFYPELFLPKDRYQLTQWTKYSAMRASKILTISKYSQDAIIQAYQLPQERVVVTYPGLSSDLDTKTNVEKNMDTNMPIPKRFILSVGTLQPRKNYRRLIEAFSILRKGGSHDDLSLLIVGKKGWLYEEILAAPAAFGVEKYVQFLDFVDDGQLQTLYKSAICFALPSLYEGFGLPVLEAMAVGCPVVVSRVSSLPEIAAEAGIYVDGQDPESIAHGLEQSISEKSQAKGKARIQKGKDQVKKFSWEKAAQQTLDVLTQVGGAS